jgi:hypothetical protein
MHSEPLKRTTLILPERVWRSAKIAAFRQGKDLQDLVAFALESYLNSVGELDPEPAGTTGDPKLPRRRRPKKGGDRR